jgi:DNA (cytosine-5)-methyltransferase 1
MFGLVVDNFAGGGGASTGIEAAIGRPVDLAVNHWAAAMRVHELNHPGTVHLCEDVFRVSPKKVCAELWRRRGLTGAPRVALAWFSPDCTHFSRAKGGKPVSKKIRGLAWVAVRWAKEARPEVIILENVPEFVDWGPLIEVEKKIPDLWEWHKRANKNSRGVPLITAKHEQAYARFVKKRKANPEYEWKPDPARKGLTFRRWVGNLRGLGYKVEHRVLVAADHGAPTTRTRLFVVARRDGRPIEWPEPTHVNPRELEGQGDLFRSARQPWRTAAECIDWSIPCPSIFERKRPLVEASEARIAQGVRRYVIEAAEPFIVTLAHTGDKGFRGAALGRPFPTQTRNNQFALVVPTLARHGHMDSHGRTWTRMDPGEGDGEHGPTRTFTDLHGPGRDACAAFLAKHYGGPRPPIGQGLERPLGTVTAVDHHGLVAAHLMKLYGTAVGSDLREPMPTVTGQGGHLAAVVAFMVKYYGNERGGVSLDEPMDTVTSKDRLALVTVWIGGEPWVIVDIGMRMLQPHELAAAQGFPEGYVLPSNKSEAVALIGNSVPPPVAEALVKANQPELAMEVAA